MTASFHPLEHKITLTPGTKFSFSFDDGETGPKTIEIVYDLTASGTRIEIDIVKYATGNKLPIEQVIMILRMAKAQELEFCEKLIDWTIGNRRMQSLAIVELLLKEGFQFSEETLGIAFIHQLPLEFVDRLYELGARPSEHSYFALRTSWKFTKSDSDTKLKNITHYLKRLKNWGQPFPKNFLSQLAKMCDVLHDGIELLKLIDVCIDAGAWISSEHIPDFVARVVQHYPAKQHSSSEFKVHNGNRQLLELLKTEQRVEIIEFHICMSKLQGLLLHQDLLNQAVRYNNTDAVINLLLKAGFKITDDTLNMAFYSVSIERIEAFYNSNAKPQPSQKTYSFLFENCWEIASQCAEMRGFDAKIARCLRLLQDWGQPLPTDLLLRISRHAGRKSLSLVHVCLNAGATIPPENIPELVAQLVDNHFHPFHLEDIEDILKKLRMNKHLFTNDERYTFLHAAIHGKNPSPKLIVFLIEKKFGVPSQAIIDFALRNAGENLKENNVLLLLNAQNAALCISHGSVILARLNLSEADKLEYLKLFFAKTKIRGEDLFIDYLKTYEITKKNVEDNLRLMKEAGIRHPRLEIDILKAHKEGKIHGSKISILIELGFLGGQTVKLKTEDLFTMKVPVLQPRVAPPHASNRNQFLAALHQERMQRKQDEEKKKSFEEKTVKSKMSLT